MIQTNLQRTQRATLSYTIFKPACNILSLNATVPQVLTSTRDIQGIHIFPKAGGSSPNKPINVKA